MGDHSRHWFAAPLLALTMGLAPVVTGPTETAVCEQTWQALAVWSDEEASLGLTTDALAELQVLLPEIESCLDETGLPSTAGVDHWRGLAAVYFQPEDLDRVMCLMSKESGGDPEARNRVSGASGLMQVMPAWADVFGYEPEDLFDPVVNLWIASQILEQQGWDAWTPYLRGSCR
jgi:hypothetical protein